MSAHHSTAIASPAIASHLEAARQGHLRARTSQHARSDRGRPDPTGVTR